MWRTTSLLFLLFLIIVGCSSKSGAPEAFAVEEDMAMESTSAEAMDESAADEYGRSATPEQLTEATPAAETTPRKIIKTGQVSIRVDDVHTSGQFMESLVERASGYVSRQEMNASSYQLASEWTIRIPAEQFDKVMEEIVQHGIHLDHKSVQARDVTEEFVDIQIRLQTKKDVRDRYVDLLRDKATTVEEVLLAEEQIRQLQEEIEAAEGRLKFLRSQTSYSTITLNMYEQLDYRPEPPARTSFWSRIGRGLANGWYGIVEFIIALTYIWPLLILLLAILVWQRRRIGRWLGR